MSIVPATRQAYVLSERRGSLYEPYRCRYCGDYHVGSSELDFADLLFGERPFKRPEIVGLWQNLY